MKGRILWPLALITAAALFYNAQTASADSLKFKLFPNIFDRTVLPDPDIASTRLKVPASNELERQILNSPIRDFSQYLTLGAQLPLASLGVSNSEANAQIPVINNTEPGITNEVSDTSLKATAVASARISPPYINKGPRYDASLELLWTYPAIVSQLSSSLDGKTKSPFFLSAGITQTGNLKVNGIENKTFQEAFSLSSISPKEYSVFGDLYFVLNSPEGTVSILRVGANNIYSSAGNPLEGHVSMAFESPSSISKYLNIKPFGSMGFYISSDQKAPTNAKLDLGVKLGKKGGIKLLDELDYNSVTGFKNYFVVEANPFNSN